MTTKNPLVRARRIYDEPTRADGHRVLVDRIWPRGVRKDLAVLDDWCQDVAPSTDLRTWYAHDPRKYAEFSRRYRGELQQPEQTAALARLRALAETDTLTLLTASKRVDISQAAVLAELLNIALEAAFDLVDEWGRQSFPASDPPANW